MKKYTILLALSSCLYSIGLAQWRPIASGVMADLDAIHFIDDQIGYCSGGFVNTFETTDGGDSWTKGNSQGFRDFSFFDETTGYGASIVTQSMGKTTNGGLSWTSITPVGFKALWAVSTTSPTTAYFSGEDGALWKTADGGNTLTVHNPGTTNLIRDIVFTTATTGYLVTEPGIVKKTEDEGISWTIVYQDSEIFFREMFFIDENIGFIVGTRGTIIKTEDAGGSWTSLGINSTKSLEGVNFFDANNGIVVGSEGMILHTTDGGTTWTFQASGTSERLLDVAMLSSEIAIVIGEKGTILKNDLILNVAEGDLEEEVLIYPNPVSNNLIISATDQINSVQIFNARGDLVMEKNSIAAKTHSFDFSKFSKGMYFVLINKEEGTRVKKIAK